MGQFVDRFCRGITSKWPSLFSCTSVLRLVFKVCSFHSLKVPVYSSATSPNIVWKDSMALRHTPNAVVSDRDRIFTNKFWKELFHIQGTMLQLSSAYHLQTDSQAERVNQNLEAYLLCLCSTIPTEWCRWMKWGEYRHNTKWKSASSFTPYKVVYGRAPPQCRSIFHTRKEVRP